MADRIIELIENVDDVTIRHHVIVPRASWDAIVAKLGRVAALHAALNRIVMNCRDADCGDHCTNSCMFCQGRAALEATTHEEWCLIDKPECGPVHCTCAALRCTNCSHGREWHLGQAVCQVFACGCEKFEAAE